MMMRIPGSVSGGRKGARPSAVTGERASRATSVGRYLVVSMMLVGLAACSKSKSEPLVSGTTTPVTTARATTTDAATTTTSTSTSTTTTLPASTQPAATTAPPPPGAPPVPTNEEWKTIIQTLYVRQTALYADPPNADVTLLCASGSECDEIYSNQLDDMVNKKWHSENDFPSEVVSVEKVVDVAATSNGSIAPGTMYEVSYTAKFGDLTNAVIVDENGNVVLKLAPPEDAPPTELASRLLTWYPQDQVLPWRFVD